MLHILFDMSLNLCLPINHYALCAVYSAMWAMPNAWMCDKIGRAWQRIRNAKLRPQSRKIFDAIQFTQFVVVVAAAVVAVLQKVKLCNLAVISFNTLSLPQNHDNNKWLLWWMNKYLIDFLYAYYATRYTYGRRSSSSKKADFFEWMGMFCVRNKNNNKNKICMLDCG